MDLETCFDSHRMQRQDLLAPGRVVVAETATNRRQQLLYAGRHMLLADRSAPDGGGDTGPDPAALVMMGLGSDLSMTLRDIADAHGWKLEQIVVYLDDRFSVRPRDRQGDERGRSGRIRCTVELVGELDERQRRALVDAANRHLARQPMRVLLAPAPEERSAA
jgi:uncharacterized OsmC-like protein